MNGRLYLRTAAWLTAAGLLATSPASAIDISSADGKFTGSFDTTVSLGATMRASGVDSTLIGTQNGGSANSVNGDNGNLNYDSGDLTSFTGKVNHELQLNFGRLGFFGRAFYFYDAEIMDWNDQARTPITDRAKDEIGRDFTLLDAYGILDVPVGGMYLTLRGGNQVLSWGESTFIQNGINAISPIDVSKLRVAGAELRDGLTAVPLIDATLSLSSRFSLEGFYQLAWDHTEIEPEGTFFSTTDLASPGGDTVLLGFGQPGIPDNPPPPPGSNPPVGLAVPRQQDRDAEDSGQFGLALRWFEPALNDTEFGFYFTRLHSRLPVISGITGTAIGLGNGDYASTARYFREFPKDIDTYGFSFNSELPFLGAALQGEVSYKVDQPLQVDDVELLFAALSPISPAFAANQLGVFGFDEEIQGYRRKDVVQAQMTLTKILGKGLGSNQIVALSEVGVTQIQDMEDKDVLRYEGPGTYTSGNDFFTQAGIQPETQADGFADDVSWGYRVVLRADYDNAIGAINLRPQLAWSHDVSGTTPAPITNFIDGRKTVTASLGATFLLSYQATLSYTNSFGGDEFNLLKDRDFLSLSASYSF